MSAKNLKDVIEGQKSLDVPQDEVTIAPKVTAQQGRPGYVTLEFEMRQGDTDDIYTIKRKAVPIHDAICLDCGKDFTMSFGRIPLHKFPIDQQEQIKRDFYLHKANGQCRKKQVTITDPEDLLVRCKTSDTYGNVATETRREFRERIEAEKERAAQGA